MVSKRLQREWLARSDNITMLDTDIIDYIVSSVQYCERATTTDRDRWILAHSIFSGEYEGGATSEDNETEAKVGLHTFSKICRGAASAAQELLHQDPKFYDFVPPSGEEMDLFGKAIEKIHRYRVKELKIENHTYRFVLAGAIAGIGINKFKIVKNLEDDEEHLLDLLEKERQKENKNLSSDIKSTEVVVAEGVDPTPQLGILDKLINGAPKKILKKKGSKVLSYKIALKIVNPINFYYDPMAEDISESSWVAERYYVSMHKLEEGFKSGTFQNREELLKELKSSQGATGSSSTSAFGSDLMTQKMIYENKTTESNPYSPMIEIIEYYGPVLEKNTGATLEENQKIIIAGGKVVLAHGPNPDWKRRPPYFYSVTSHVPFKGVGAGIADNGVDQELIGNQIMNLALEHLAFNVKGVTAVDMGALDDESALESGLTPGQIIMTRGDSRPVKDLFHNLDHNPNLTFSAMQMLEKLELSASSAASVDTQGSNPSSRSRISAAEIRSNGDKTSRSQFSLARELDETYLEELLIRVLDFVLQYDLENQPLEEFMNAGIISRSEHDMIQSIPTNERLREAKRRYRLDVRGFRERLERNEYLTRLSEYMQQVNMTMNVAPEVKGMFDFKEILRMFSEAYGLNTDKIIRQNSPSDVAMEENIFLADDRQIEVHQDDEHQQHLPVHYDSAMQNPTEATITHIVTHMQIAQQAGMPFPPPPPELENLIFGPPEQGIEDEQQANPVGAPMAGPDTFQ